MYWAIPLFVLFLTAKVLTYLKVVLLYSPCCCFCLSDYLMRVIISWKREQFTRRGALGFVSSTWRPLPSSPNTWLRPFGTWEQHSTSFIHCVGLFKCVDVCSLLSGVKREPVQNERDDSIVIYNWDHRCRSIWVSGASPNTFYPTPIRFQQKQTESKELFIGATLL